jgi:hypothetical protein
MLLGFGLRKDLFNPNKIKTKSIFFRQNNGPRVTLYHYWVGCPVSALASALASHQDDPCSNPDMGAREFGMGPGIWVYHYVLRLPLPNKIIVPTTVIDIQLFLFNL